MTESRPLLRVQAGQPTYELYSLGWKSFQHLCASIAAEIWGQTVETFFDARDGGRDGAFHGTWRSNAGLHYQGTFTVQCKATLRSDKSIKLLDLTDEIAKAERLAAKGLADNYFLFTTGRLTGVDEERIRARFQAISGLRTFTAFGVEAISRFINESARLRMLVPRIYGLGDLSQILDVRAYDQASDILSSMGDDLEKFVITDAYLQAQKALLKHGFVLLLGEPACGKSTIAAALALGALDEWGCFTIKLRNADEFVTHWNPNEPKQFFWVDDAFGATQLDLGSSPKWNSAFGHVQAAIKRGARFVFTSRDYIYRSARNFLKSSALPIMLESQVVIDVTKLSTTERQQILYNHIRLGLQPQNFKTRIKPFLSSVAKHHNFGPEIARRLGNPVFTSKLELTNAALDDFVAKPMDHLREVIQTLDVESRAALGLVFMRGGNLVSPVDLTADERDAVERMGATFRSVHDALKALDGSFLLQQHVKGIYAWRFKHPTVRDAMASLIVEDRELLDIYLRGTPTGQLFNEISCGDVGLKGVKVIVPPDRYGPILERASFHLRRRGDHEHETHRFLAQRCDKAFMCEFLASNPAFLGELRIQSYFTSVSDVGVILRLHKLGLLPEAERRRHITAIRDLAATTPDEGILRNDIRELFTASEFEEAIEYIRSELVENLPEILNIWVDSRDEDQNPDEYMSDYQSALERFKIEFFARGDEMAVDLLEEGLRAGELAIQAMWEEMPEEPDYDNDGYLASSVHDHANEERSVFDDVDS